VLVILAALSALFLSVVGFYEEWYGGTAGEAALGAAWAVVLIAVGAALRHWSALIVPAVVLVGIQVLGRYWLAHPGTFDGPPAEPGVVRMTTIFLTGLSAFFVLAGWCAARMVEPDAHRRARLSALGVYAVAMAGILPVLFQYNVSDGRVMTVLFNALLVLFPIAAGAAACAVGRLDGVPVVGLIPWVIAFAGVSGGALLFPSPGAGETPLSWFLESPFWILLPTLIPGLIGAGLGVAMRAGPAPAATSA
jgi:hypothetical protein